MNDILLNDMPFVIFLYLLHPIFYSCHIFTFPSVLIFKPLRFKQKISAQILSNICSGKCFEVQCAFSPVLILSKQREIKSSSQMDSSYKHMASFAPDNIRLIYAIRSEGQHGTGGGRNGTIMRKGHWEFTNSQNTYLIFVFFCTAPYHSKWSA